ncbi:hypothetical protein N5A92_23075 [Chelativorans sp. EGI FJ00035]|uniref:Uncharacterized protein n=2 Tax=Chelativorans salis TaxID=2978478 RepID=A0ABT2LTN9_9HYPH|nr:hypothetical protein [Chelativorans sp. EGI FJ00035]
MAVILRSGAKALEDHTPLKAPWSLVLSILAIAVLMAGFFFCLAPRSQAKPPVSCSGYALGRHSLRARGWIVAFMRLLRRLRESALHLRAASDHEFGIVQRPQRAAVLFMANEIGDLGLLRGILELARSYER